MPTVDGDLFFSILFPPLPYPSMSGASHILYVSSTWPDTWLLIIGGNHYVLRGSVLYGVQLAEFVLYCCVS